MKNIIYYSFLLALVSIGLSCKTNTKPSTVLETEIEDPSTKSELTLISEGYVKAIVLDKQNHYDCGFLIQLEQDDQLLFPLRLKEELKQDHLKVWILFRPIRPIQANCPDAKPVEIEGIQTRNF